MVEKSHTSGFWPALHEPLRHFGERVADWIAPPSEASSAEAAYHISVELPGVAEEDIHLSVEDGVVTLKGEKRTAREDKGETWYFSERQYGAFSRSFRLPPDAEGDKVSAVLRDGVLSLMIPRRVAKAPEGGKRVKIAKG